MNIKEPWFLRSNRVSTVEKGGCITFVRLSIPKTLTVEFVAEYREFIER